MTSIQMLVAYMLLAHLVADYTLQGWLADGKQKSWWEGVLREHGLGKLSESKYRFDYIAALVSHSLYWSILVFLPFHESSWFLLSIIANAAFHAVVDDLKANRFKLNLIQDQLLHVFQMGITFIILT